MKQQPPTPPPIREPRPTAPRVESRTQRQSHLVVVSVLSAVCILLLILLTMQTMRTDAPAATPQPQADSATARKEFQVIESRLRGLEVRLRRREAELDERARRLDDALERITGEEVGRGEIDFGGGNDEQGEGQVRFVDNGGELGVGADADDRDDDAEVPDDLLAENSVDKAIEELRKAPGPKTRAYAALSLGRRTTFTDKVVPALLGAYREDTAPEVRHAAIVALGRVGDAGEYTNQVTALLSDIVFETQSDMLRRAAAESLITIAPESPHVRRILRTALIGRKTPPPIPARRRSNDVVMGNRLWAYSQLTKPKVDGTWAVGLLIDIMEVEIEQVLQEPRLYRTEYALHGYTAYIDAMLDT